MQSSAYLACRNRKRNHSEQTINERWIRITQMKPTHPNAEWGLKWKEINRNGKFNESKLKSWSNHTKTDILITFSRSPIISNLTMGAQPRIHEGERVDRGKLRIITRKHNNCTHQDQPLWTDRETHPSTAGEMERREHQRQRQHDWNANGSANEIRPLSRSHPMKDEVHAHIQPALIHSAFFRFFPAPAHPPAFLFLTVIAPSNHHRCPLLIKQPFLLLD